MRSISRILPGQPAMDGDGVRILRFALLGRPEADPFLLLDELRSAERADFVGRFPPHPHRGMETLTVMLDGGLVHEDHLGNRGEIRAGGAQWMSAGRGVIHSEMPTLDTRGLHGFQLWINLPAAAKMKTPDYRDLPAEQIPDRSGAFGRLRLIAGRWIVDGQPADGILDRIAAEAGVADLRLQPGAGVSIGVPAGHSLSIYVYAGGLAGSPGVSAREFAMTAGEGELRLEAGAAGAEALLLHGQPLREPIASHGPFVMNTEQQIREAIRDYREGRFGI